MKHFPDTYKINGLMVTSLLVNLDAATAVLFVAYAATKVAGHDAWLAPLVATPASLLLIYTLYHLGKLYPGKTLIEYLPLLLGKVLGKLIGAGYLVFFSWITVVVVRELIEVYLGTGVFTFTPPLIMALTLLMLTTYATYSGIEVIARSMLLVWGPMLGLFMVVILMSIPLMNLKNLLPVGEAGVMPILRSSIIPHMWRGEIVLLAMLFPYIRTYREGLKGARVAIFIVAGVVTLDALTVIAVDGAASTSRNLFSTFLLAEYIPFFSAKILVVILWIMGFYGKIALLQFCVTQGLAQWLGLQDYKSLVLPIGVLLIILPLAIFHNSTDMFNAIFKIFPGFALIFEYMLPALLLFIGLIRARVASMSGGRKG